MKRFEQIYEQRDKVPVYHYPLPVNGADSEYKAGTCLQNVKTQNVVNAEGSNLYVHIPFCKSLCSFCPFTKWVGDDKKIKEYLKYLKKEIKIYSGLPGIKNMEFSAVYLGGGTPSLLSGDQLEDILGTLKKTFLITDDAEITVEGSPSSFSVEKFEQLKAAGVTRISMGVQTLNAERSELIGLPQSPEVSKARIKEAINAGFYTVSADLIYNLPGQNVEEFMEDVKEAVGLGLQQLTLFPLEVSSSTPLAAKLKSGELPQIMNQEEEYLYYSTAADFLSKNGFIQLTNVDWVREIDQFRYSVQHFVKGVEILGLGAGAFGEVQGYSYINTGNLEEYYDDIDNNQLPAKRTADAENERPYKYVVLGLRGLHISEEDFQNKFGISIYEMFSEQIAKAVERGLMVRTVSGLSVTSLGAFYLNDLSKEFMSKLYENVSMAAFAVESICKD